MRFHWLIPCALALACASEVPAELHRSVFRTNDVVAFVGGADVVVAQQSGHLEGLLAAATHGKHVRFRNFGWEGDTVFEQPRDFAFPPLLRNLQKAGATVVFLQFGRGEVLDGRNAGEFVAAYRKLLDDVSRQTDRLVLVTPVPFERRDDPLPDLSKRNHDLAAIGNAIQNLARERSIPVVDLFGELSRVPRSAPLTCDGLQLTAQGAGLVAEAFARQLGLEKIVSAAGGIDRTGAWANSDFERIRQAVIKKNRFWYDYSRPQNWAFLGGDRTSQPSSRDHHDPKIRWFPAEMEKFLPLIAEAETNIAQAAAAAAKPR